MKNCFKCNLLKPLEDFYKHPQMPDGRVGKCKECNKTDVRNNYQKTIIEKREYDSYRNRHSIPRIFAHRYAGIKARCTLPRANGNYYQVFGKKYLTKKQWLDWCYEEKNYKKFTDLYNNWVQSGFQEKTSPSVD